MPLPADFLASLAAADDRYRPHLMWFWNAPLQEAEVRRQVRGFHEAGILEFYIHPMFGFPVDYLSDAMFEALGWAIDEAERLGMRFWIYDEYNWPSGAAGSYVIRDHPERRMLILERRQWREGEAIPELPGPEVGRFSSSDGTVSAYAEVPQNGVCPFSQWSPFCWNQEGYADVSDPQTVQAFIERTHEAYREHFGEHFGATIRGLFTDEVSYALAGAYGQAEAPIPWSHGFTQAFSERFGYDITSCLRSLMQDEGDFRRVRHDYWTLMAERLETAYYRQCAEWCEQAGLILTGHVSGEELLRHALLFFGDIHGCLRWLHYPGIDAIFPRFNHSAEHFIVGPKSGASVLRHSGRERLLCETYTGSGWEMTPLEMKVIFDKLALAGVNLLQYMGAYYSVAGMRKCLPGGYPPSHSFQNAYFSHYRQFGDYVARICQVVAQSRPTARLAVVYPLTAAQCEWRGSIGDFHGIAHAPPRFAALQQALLAVTNILVEASVDFDYLFESVLRQGRVADGALLCEHAEYDLLILPGATCLSAGAAEVLAHYVAAGGTTLVLNHVPEWSAGCTTLESAVQRTVGCTPDEANARVDAHLQAAAGTQVVDCPPAQWILSSDLTTEARASLAETLLPLIATQYRATQGIPAGVVATRRELRGSPVVVLMNQTGEHHEFSCPEGTTALLDPETGECHASVDRIGLAPYQTLIAVDAEAQSPPSPIAQCTHELVLGEAQFTTHEPNLWAASWELEIPDTGEWIAVDGLRLAPAHAVPPGREYRLRWRVDVREKAGPMEFVTEDLGESLEVTVNGHQIAELQPSRVWDWLNLSADITDLIVVGQNELVLSTRTPAWDAPHTPPQAALRGRFAVSDGAAIPAITHLHPGSWAEQGYPNYAGTATYRWELQLDAISGPVYIESDDIAHIATLTVNGRRLPTRLWPPYRFDVTGYLREGRNDIALEVTSTSGNLLGLSDSSLLLHGAEKTTREMPLPAGLVRPLRLRW